MGVSSKIFAPDRCLFPDSQPRGPVTGQSAHSAQSKYSMQERLRQFSAALKSNYFSSNLGSVVHTCLPVMRGMRTAHDVVRRR
jgi:hypothetical protein